MIRPHARAMLERLTNRMLGERIRRLYGRRERGTQLIAPTTADPQELEISDAPVYAALYLLMVHN